ncbi:MAG: hypothetical protein ACLU0O_08880 [Collinsella sp.]
MVSAAIRLEMGRGGQVYYVSNRVKTIDDAVARVHEAAPEARVGVAHGKMSPREVEDVMIEFATKDRCAHRHDHRGERHRQRKPHADHRGLAAPWPGAALPAQGRVGRSATQAYAYFMFPGELPLTEEATARLTALSEFQDLGSGMRIAMRDLEIRGAGSLMGAEQHGNLSSVGFGLFTQMLARPWPRRAAMTTPAWRRRAWVLTCRPTTSCPRSTCRRWISACSCTVARSGRGPESIDEVQEETEAAHGELPLAGLNLFNRARIRIRGERLGSRASRSAAVASRFWASTCPRRWPLSLRPAMAR